MLLYLKISKSKSSKNSPLTTFWNKNDIKYRNLESEGQVLYKELTVNNPVFYHGGHTERLELGAP